jgi:hypothetical protein
MRSCCGILFVMCEFMEKENLLKIEFVNAFENEFEKIKRENPFIPLSHTLLVCLA